MTEHRTHRKHRTARTEKRISRRRRAETRMTRKILWSIANEPTATAEQRLTALRMIREHRYTERGK